MKNINLGVILVALIIILIIAFISIGSRLNKVEDRLDTLTPARVDTERVTFTEIDWYLEKPKSGKLSIPMEYLKRAIISQDSDSMWLLSVDDRWFWRVKENPLEYLK